MPRITSVLRGRKLATRQQYFSCDVTVPATTPNFTIVAAPVRAMYVMCVASVMGRSSR